MTGTPVVSRTAVIHSLKPASLRLHCIEKAMWGSAYTLPVSTVRTFTLQDSSPLRLWGLRLDPVDSQSKHCYCFCFNPQSVDS